jgi:hypothetical protein
MLVYWFSLSLVSTYIYIHNGKWETDGQAIFLNLFTVCLHANESYPFVNGLNCGKPAISLQFQVPLAQWSTWSHTALLSRFHTCCRSSLRLHSQHSRLLGGTLGEPAISLQLHSSTGPVVHPFASCYEGPGFNPQGATYVKPGFSC